MHLIDVFYGIAGIIVAVVAIAGLVYGFNGSSKKNTITAIMQENTSLRNQLGDATNANTSLTVRAEKSEKNEQYLKDLAQSKPDYEKIITINQQLSLQLTKQHKEILNSFKGLTNGVTKLANSIARERKGK